MPDNLCDCSKNLKNLQRDIRTCQHRLNNFHLKWASIGPDRLRLEKHLTPVDSLICYTRSSDSFGRTFWEISSSLRRILWTRILSGVWNVGLALLPTRKSNQSLASFPPSIIRLQTHAMSILLQSMSGWEEFLSHTYNPDSDHSKTEKQTISSHDGQPDQPEQNWRGGGVSRNWTHVRSPTFVWDVVCVTSVNEPMTSGGTSVSA